MPYVFLIIVVKSLTDKLSASQNALKADSKTKFVFKGKFVKIQTTRRIQQERRINWRKARNHFSSKIFNLTNKDVKLDLSMLNFETNLLLT